MDKEKTALYTSQLNELLDKEENKIGNAHFEIGSKLHIDTYYNAKKIFQDKENSEKIAWLLSEKIRSVGKSVNNTTLIGYGSYSGLFLSKTIDLLQQDDLNYALVDRAEGKISFLFQPELKQHLVVILAVSCTFNSFFSIKKFLAEYTAANGPYCQIDPDCITIFLITDEQLLLDVDSVGEVDISSGDSDIKKLYAGYYWNKIDRDKASFTKDAPSHGYYLLTNSSGLYLIEKCPLCFCRRPEDMQKERPLFENHVNYDAPNIIFGLPDFATPPLREDNGRFKRLFGARQKGIYPHIYGYLKIGEYSYLNYIQRDVFYVNNKEEILNFFNQKIPGILFPNGPLQKVTNIVIITPGHLRTSTFLEDWLKADAWNGKKITVISYQPFREYLINFKNTYGDVLAESDKILYFDDTISGGKIFKRISDHLKDILMPLDQQWKEDKGFDAVLTLLDRSTNESKGEILRKLRNHLRKNQEAGYIPFFTLSVPPIDPAHIGNPIDERNSMFQGMFNECHLDALKMIIGDNLYKGRALKLNELIDKYSREDIAYFPFTLNEEMTTKYLDRYTHQQKNLMKLQIFHHISEWFANIKTIYPPGKFDQRGLERLLEFLVASEKLSSYFITPEGARPTPQEHAIEKMIATEIALKMLSRSPFKNYREINETTFTYINGQLQLLMKDIDSIVNSKASDDPEENILQYEAFFKLNFFIRRSVELNSNFIISHNFITQLKNCLIREEIFSQPTHTGHGKVFSKNLAYEARARRSFKYSLLQSYKRLIYKNPARSMVLEELLAKEDLLPEGMRSDESIIPLHEFIQSPYYQLHRILKAENIQPLNALIIDYLSRRSFIRDTFNEKDHLAAIKNMYFSGTLSEVYDVKQAQVFLSRARQPDEVINAAANMLYAVSLLNNAQKNNKVKKEHKEWDEEEIFNDEIKRILNAVCGILGNDLKYSFFIEYKEKREEEEGDTDNIFTILSDDKENLDDGKMISLHKDGLVYNMIYGLKDFENGNLQTFIGIAKNGDEILSFSDAYYKVAPATEEEGAQAPEKLIVRDALEKDYDNNETGIKMIKEASMILLFRLAEVVLDEHGCQHRSYAVLAICSTTEATTSNFARFINVDKVRLLLLIKEQLIEYLKKQFNNDAFIEVLESREFKKLQRKLRHGIPSYIRALGNYASLIAERVEIPKNLQLHQIVGQAIVGQISSKKSNLYTSHKNYSMYELTTLFRILFEDSSLGGYSVNFKDVHLTLLQPKDQLSIPPVVFTVVFPELIVNMKKNAPLMGKPGFIISFKDGVFEFRNNIRPNETALFKEKAYGGISMCNKILASLDLGNLQPEYNRKDNYFSIRIDLSKKTA